MTDHDRGPGWASSCWTPGFAVLLPRAKNGGWPLLARAPQPSLTRNIIWGLGSANDTSAGRCAAASLACEVLSKPRRFPAALGFSKSQGQRGTADSGGDKMEPGQCRFNGAKALCGNLSLSAAAGQGAGCRCPVSQPMAWPVHASHTGLRPGASADGRISGVTQPGVEGVADGKA
jgi:hypothetical protein